MSEKILEVKSLNDRVNQVRSQYLEDFSTPVDADEKPVMSKEVVDAYNEAIDLYKSDELDAETKKDLFEMIEDWAKKYDLN